MLAIASRVSLPCKVLSMYPGGGGAKFWMWRGDEPDALTGRWTRGGEKGAALVEGVMRGRREGGRGVGWRGGERSRGSERVIG